MDPIAAVLCGAGAAVVLGGWGHESLMELCVLGATFYGISRATRSRAALGLVGALLVVWFLSHFWTFVPEKLLGTGFGEPNAAHHDAPTWWAEVLMKLTLLGSIVVARSKIGWGLTVLTGAAMVIALLAHLGSTLLHKPSDTDGDLLGAIASGWLSVIPGLVAAAWLIVGLGFPPPTAISRRVAPMLGAVGAVLIAATLQAQVRDAAVAAVLGTMLVAWVLSAVGLGSLAREGGAGPAWAGMALVIAQLVIGFPVGFVVFSKMLDRNFPDVVAMTMPLGLVGFGIAALSAKALPLGAARGLVGVLFLVGAFGALLTLLTFFVGSHVRDPVWPLESFMRSATVLGLSLWASYLAYVALPPAPSTG